MVELNKASEFIAHLLTRYKSGTLSTIFSNCFNPSVNLAVKTGKIERNLYKEIPLQKSKPKAIEAYEPEEVRTIVGAFYSDEYVKKGSIFPHNYVPLLLLKEKISKGTNQMEFLTNTIALSFVDKLREEVNRYEGVSDNDYDLQTTIKYILGMAVDIQIYRS